MGKTAKKGRDTYLYLSAGLCCFPRYARWSAGAYLIAAKALPSERLWSPPLRYQKQVLKVQTMAETFVELGYGVVSGGTDNALPHSITDLRKEVPRAYC